MKVMQDHEIGSLWKGTWPVGDEPRGHQRADPQADRGKNFQVGFEAALQTFGISKEEYGKL